MKQKWIIPYNRPFLFIFRDFSYLFKEVTAVGIAQIMRLFVFLFSIFVDVLPISWLSYDG